MKKRILSIICAVMIVATLFSIAITSASGATEAVNITAGFTQDIWEGHTEGIQVAWDKFAPTSASGATKTITTKTGYNLGDSWTASFKIGSNSSSNYFAEPFALRVGDLVAVFYDRNKNDTNSVAQVELKKDTASLEKVNLPDTIGSKKSSGAFGTMKLEYDNGTAKLYFEDIVYITKDVGDMDFSNAKATVSIKDRWIAKSAAVVNFALIGSTPIASSTPASSTPASSAPASSVPASSAPASSAPESSEAPVSSAPVPKYDDVTEFEAEGFDSTYWTGDTSNIAGSGALISQANNNVLTLTTVNSYNLGTLWASSFVTGNNTGNRNGNAYTLKIGQLEAVLYEENTATGDGMMVELKKNGASVKKIAIGDRVTAKYLVLKYDNGTATVGYNNHTYITENVGDMDFSNVKATVSVEGNGKATAIAINKFTLKHMSTGEESSSAAPAVGEAITPVIDGALTKSDWEGDIKRIDSAGQFNGPDGSKNTITSVKTYDLSGGFKFASTLTFKNHFSNYYGEYASMYVGDPETGLELRIKQDKENRGNSAFYNGYLLYNGAEIASVDLLNAPNGKWEITYKDGKVTVTQADAAIKWTLADKSTATSVALDSPDFKAAKLGFYIEGNYCNSHRYWKNYSITDASGSSGSGGAGGVGGTGDARELVVPAVAIVLGACAAAFVIKHRKTVA